MKKYFFLLFVVSSQIITSQVYESIVDQTKKWDTLETVYDVAPAPGDPEVSYYTRSNSIGGSIMVNGVSYNEIIGNHNVGANYIRENANNQVYLSPGVNGDSESLIYDFTLLLGDTIDLPEYFSNQYLTWTVTDVTTVFMANSNRKQITLEWNGNIEIWYEGIGSSKGFLYSGYMPIDFDENLSCYFQNNNLLHSTGTCNTASIEERNSSFAEKFNLFPNPANKQLNISSSLTDYSIEIYSILGASVLKTKSTTVLNQLDISNLEQGFYLIILKTETNTATFKLVKN